jgi:hypothetical protein
MVQVQRRHAQNPENCLQQCRCCLRFVFIINGAPFRQHAFVQDAGNENSSPLTPKKHNVLALFHAAQAVANVIAGSASLWQQASSSSIYRMVWASPQVRKVYVPMFISSASARRDKRNRATA